MFIELILKMKILSSKKGVALIVVFSIIIVITAYLSGYVTWAIWDHRSLLRQQATERAGELARSGLNRAIEDLYLDGFWLDGDINGHPVTAPDPNNPDPVPLSILYNAEPLGDGTYTVEIDYLQSPRSCATGCPFLDGQMWVRATGTVPYSTGSVSRTLEQLVRVGGRLPVYNFDQLKLYANLQPAVDEANNNDHIGVTEATLVENVVINAAQHFIIKGGYDPDFTDVNIRSCSLYPSIIQGSVSISGNAEVDFSGFTID